MSPEGVAAARRRIELRLADCVKKFGLGSEETIGQHNARGMLRSGAMIMAAHRQCEAEYLERAQVAWGVARTVIDQEGWTPTEDNRNQLRELIAYAVGPASADVAAYSERVHSFMPDAKVPGLESGREHALQSALADAELDLLGRQARRLPLEDELSAPRYQPAREHWRKAIEYAKQDPSDLPNATKEAIGSLESLAQLVAGISGATLGDAVKELRSRKRLPVGADKILEGLYAFASSAPGSRHGSPLPAHIDPSHWGFVRTSTEGALRLLLDLDAANQQT